ncbi:MAG: hypothetical protein ACRDRJ_29810 [Streptosporangiaceae bacterium]
MTGAADAGGPAGHEGPGSNHAGLTAEHCDEHKHESASRTTVVSSVSAAAMTSGGLGQDIEGNEFCLD